MTDENKPRVLVIGGYGVFGGLLSRRLTRHDDIEVLVAGRRIEAAEAHCAVHGGTAVAIDTSGDLSALLRELAPAVVIDAAGPFQDYGDDPYRVAIAAINAGAHYLDLADDAGFVAGIEALDEAARARRVVVLSGCSSVPAISAAAVNALRPGFESIDYISSAILPGNRAPRGRSVMRAILAQVGKPIAIYAGGEWRNVPGWCSTERLSPAISGKARLGARLASPIGAPDLKLFPAHFGARTVRFRAGLEVGLMHRGLAMIAWLVRARLLPSAVMLTAPLLWLANLMKPLGSDRGGMTVEVGGRGADGLAMQRRWTLIAEAGDGPEIPPTPAYLLALRLCRKTVPVAPGARPALDDLALHDIEAGLAEFAIETAMTVPAAATLFERVLEDEFQRLPAPLKDLHDVQDTRLFAGRASVERGEGLLSRMIGWWMGFPPRSCDVPVRVEMQRTGDGETWRRWFGAAAFRSHLSRPAGARHGEITEHFGILSFRLALYRNGGVLQYPVDGGRIFGLFALPNALLPVSETREFVDEAGRAAFDAKVSVWPAGLIVRYKGWLRPISCTSGPVQSELKTVG